MPEQSTILAVDDTPQNISLLSELLKDQYRLKVAISGELALRIAFSDAPPDPQSVARRLGNGIAAAESCVTALYLALRFLAASFDELQSFVAECGGDVDTIGAMAGAVWGGCHGVSALPLDELAKLEDVDRLRSVAVALHRASVSA